VDAPRVSAGPLTWPAPEVHRSADGSITSYGYGGEVVLFTTARAQPDVQPPLTVVATVEVLVCEVQCIPARFELTRVLGVGPRQADSAGAALLDAAEARVPREPTRAGLRVSVRRTTPFVPGQPFEGELTVERADGSPEALASTDAFVPERLAGIASVQDFGEGPGKLRLWGKASPDAASAPPRMAGVVALASGGALEVSAPFELPPGLAPHAAAATPPVPARAPGLPWILLLAFLGGVLLNAMPCVFPVLALKAYGFARTVHADHGSVRMHALAYTGGILGSLLVLAGAVLGLRAAGHAVGWGFQFQEPLFVAVLSGLVLLFALNLLGVFELTVPSHGTGTLVAAVDHAHGPLRSAGEGVLAVVLATPCSAPLLGTAVGFAFAARAPVVLAVFATVGLGLAAPFCALVLVPGLRRRLPRPGAWMERAKQLLGFALLGTGVWLAGILGSLAGVDGVVRLLAFLVVLALVAWAWGAWRRQPVLLGGLLLVLGTGSVALRFGSGPSAVAGREAWSDEAVSYGLAQGRPVLVDFTAEWCLSCKFNERTVLASRPCSRRWRAPGRRSWWLTDTTRRGHRAQVAAHGRAGVPMYLVYSRRGGPARGVARAAHRGHRGVRARASGRRAGLAGSLVVSEVNNTMSLLRLLLVCASCRSPPRSRRRRGQPAPALTSGTRSAPRTRSTSTEERSSSSSGPTPSVPSSSATTPARRCRGRWPRSPARRWSGSRWTPPATTPRRSRSPGRRSRGSPIRCSRTRAARSAGPTGRRPRRTCS
jgi:thiol:disulfide interchange protein DsbD